MEIDAYPEWTEALDRVSGSARTLMLVGDTDTGKTTFCTLLVNAALAAGRRVAVVDADVGQSEIGPPACVSLGMPAGPVTSLVAVPAARSAFVGSTSPRGVLLEHTAAVAAMVAAAREAGAELVVLDTTGFISGPGARRLKHAQYEILQPDHVVALQRRGECEPVLLPLRYSTRAHVLRLSVPAAIATKTPAVRAQRRAARFARYFQGCELRMVSLENVSITGSWLGSGTPVPPHVLRFAADALGVRVFYGEQQDRHLGLVVQAMPEANQGMSVIQEHLRPREIGLTQAARLRHLLTGLADGDGRLLALGLIEAVDFRRRQVGLLTPLRAPGAVRLLHFGLLRLRPDGTEVGILRPGEL